MPDVPNGFDVHAGTFGVSGKGPNALSYLVVVTLIATLGFLAWTNWTSFGRIEKSLSTLSNDIRCLAWAAASEETRARLPVCARDGAP